MTDYAVHYAQASLVSDLAHALLTTATATLTSPPADRYVAMGKPAADGCDQLVVWADTFTLVRPAGTLANSLASRDSLEPGGALPAVVFNVQLLRCGAPVPDGNVLPTPAEMDAHATTALTDAWALYRGLLAALSAGTLFGTPNPVPAHHTLIRDMTAYGPEGGVAGWSVPVRVSLY